MNDRISLRVDREHGNTGDVRLHLKHGDMPEQTFCIPGDVTPYTAFAALKPWLEERINAMQVHEPEVEIVDIEPLPDTEPERAEVAS